MNNKKLKHEKTKNKSLERRRKRLNKKKLKNTIKRVNNNTNEGFIRGSFAPPADKLSDSTSKVLKKEFDTIAWKPQ